MIIVVVDFITKNIIGIILFNVFCGIIGSVVGALLYKTMLRKYKKRRFKRYLIKSGTYFGSGSRTVYAMNKTSFHQALLVGDYLIQILVSIGKLIMSSMVFLALIVILRTFWFSSPIIISVAGFFCGVELRKLRDYLRIYHEMFRYVYGEEYFKSEMEGIKQYWDKTTGK